MAGVNNIINNYPLPLSGGTMVGNLILNADPSTGLQAATKAYVDMIGAGFNFEASCVAGTTADVNATYLNGTAGIGATLTAVALTAFTIDGVTPALNDRVLIKNQASTFQNGIYTVTTLANVGVTPWILTRATNYDQAAEINPGDLVITDGGSTQAARGWLQTATVATIGTDPIVFVMFGANSVTSVTGTTNRITSTGGTTPVLDISASYAGQSSIVTTGALSAGSLATGFTAVTVPLGGTGLTTATTAYAPIISGTTATSSFQVASTGLSTAGSVLTSNGSSAVPSWKPAGAVSGGFVLLSTTNVSTQGTINLYNLFDSTYDSYWIQFVGLQINVNAEAAWLRFGTGATPTIKTGGSDYKYVTNEVTSLGSSSQLIDGGTADHIMLTPNISGTATDAAATMSGSLYVYNCASGSLFTTVIYDLVSQTSAGTYCLSARGTAASTFTTAVTSLQFTTNDFGVASYVAGKVKVYGIV